MTEKWQDVEQETPICLEEECAMWDQFDQCCSVEPKQCSCPYYEENCDEPMD